ncbi:MAG: hypothetical protein KZQ99_15840 [Candidatus Thiodiazotropha sp. (ex Dulcina madagascariensis)]|nr:hypothetical protein [Candidatus Thiodiazotropha sp. (ex Dulcina madagascariensis)]MCU7936320.1 hypothetical protein [Candidatus Thiodiazotropha sp. (ex Dulcina madagascariensis)]
MLKELKKNETSLSEDLHNYCDEFKAFNERCDRLCEAFVNIAAHHESISSYSVRGMKHNAQWIKYRINELRERLLAIYERSLNER